MPNTLKRDVWTARVGFLAVGIPLLMLVPDWYAPVVAGTLFLAYSMVFEYFIISSSLSYSYTAIPNLAITTIRDMINQGKIQPAYAFTLPWATTIRDLEDLKDIILPYPFNGIYEVCRTHWIIGLPSKWLCGNVRRFELTLKKKSRIRWVYNLLPLMLLVLAVTNPHRFPVSFWHGVGSLRSDWKEAVWIMVVTQVFGVLFNRLLGTIRVKHNTWYETKESLVNAPLREELTDGWILTVSVTIVLTWFGVHPVAAYYGGTFFCVAYFAICHVCSLKMQRIQLAVYRLLFNYMLLSFGIIPAIIVHSTLNFVNTLSYINKEG